MKVAYFAWIRERIGKTDERLDPPADIKTVENMIAWLSARGEEYAYAFENPTLVRVALDQMHVKHDAPIAGAGEIAFFPPMTGG